MTRPTDDELRERVREATGPDRELDAAITVALQIGVRKNLPDDLEFLQQTVKSDECAPGTYWFVRRSGMSLRTSEPLTASLDAALALVERVLPGCDVILKRGHLGPYSSATLGKVCRPSHMQNWGFAERADDELPLAILEALLAALIDRQHKDSPNDR